MLAMDVVDTLRHRERLVERELNEDVRDEQLIDRLRALYKSQGIDVPDRILAQGVKALKESRFVYTPPPSSFQHDAGANSGSSGGPTGNGRPGRWLRWLSSSVLYQYIVVRPRKRAAEAARMEISETLPHQLTTAHGAATAEARVPLRTRARRCDPDPRSFRARAWQRGGRTRECRRARPAIRHSCDRNTCFGSRDVLEDQTGFFREHPSFQGRAYFVVVDAIDPESRPGSATDPQRRDQPGGDRVAFRCPRADRDIRRRAQRQGEERNFAERAHGGEAPRFPRARIPDAGTRRPHHALVRT